MSQPGRVYRRGKKWYVDITLPDGRRIRRSAGGETEAKRWLNALRVEAQEQLDIHTEEHGTISSLWNHYLDRSRREGRRPSTLRAINLAKDRSAPINRKRPERLTQKEADAWADGLSKQLAASTVNTTLSYLKAAISRAISDGLLPPDAMRVKFKSRKVMRSAPTIVSESDWRRMVRTASKPEYNPYMIPLLYLCRYSGIRISEALYLSLSDVDFSTPELRIRSKPTHNYVVKNWEDRMIPMAAPLKDVLSTHVAQLPERDAEWKIEWLFPSTRKPLIPLPAPTAARWIKQLSTELNLPISGWHVLRRTFASDLLGPGADIVTVMKLLGHANLTTTQRYLASLPDAARRAVDLLT